MKEEGYCLIVKRIARMRLFLSFCALINYPSKLINFCVCVFNFLVYCKSMNNESHAADLVHSFCDIMEVSNACPSLC